MDFAQLKELISIVNASKLTEFDLKMDNTTVSMSKNAAPRPSKAVEEERADTTAADIYEKEDEPVTIVPKAKEEPKEGEIITAPLVGTYYESPSPEAAPFVKIGARVEKGRVLCIIEAMKVMNEITAKLDGEIAEIFVKDGQMVEYNQPLFRIV